MLEFAQKGDLGKLLRSKKSLEENEAKKYICEIILAIEALHKNHTIFRDLKPDNILLDS